MKTWIHTDTHFGHEKLVTIEARPADYEERILKHWRGMVQPEDLVIHLGDVALGKEKELRSLLESLPGRKILTKGNHDHKSLHWYMQNGFAFACHSFTMRHVLFTHEPAPSLAPGTVLNVHGHLHDDTHRIAPGWTAQPWHKLLAIEFTDYAPVEFDKFVGRDLQRLKNGLVVAKEQFLCEPPSDAAH